MYPFSAIVGQDRLKTALLLCVVDPGIGGVLVRGEKGTAKSTTVRALANLLPDIEVAAGCPFSCDPADGNGACPWCSDNGNGRGVERRRVRVLTLPLNATEDRVAGGLDFEQAVRTGQRHFSPGLLAQAHRGILYVDEVNLLDDHLVDLVLDAAASGTNRVEREGISFSHPSRFVLVGTMNPEEGELRPQFLDRFGLCVDVSGEQDPETRAMVMETREAHDTDPSDFFARYQEADDAFAAQILTARASLGSVTLTTQQRNRIVSLCREAGVAGHRADIVMERTARAHAALTGRNSVEDEDIAEAARLVLPHRFREAEPPPPPPPEPPPQEPEDSPDDPPPERDSQAPPPSPEHDPAEQPPAQAPPPPSNRPVEERIFEIGKTFGVRRIETRKDRLARRGTGRRSRTRTAEKKGRYVKSRLADMGADLALDATLRAAAPHQAERRGAGPMAVNIRPQDIRAKVREKRIGNVIVFCVDASGSMGAGKRMAAAKGAVMSLLLSAYRMRDHVALVAFRKSGAELLLPPTNSVSLAARYLETLPTGGRTPLSAGLSKAYEVARNRLFKDPLARPIVIVITDGRSNVALNGDRKPLDEAAAVAARISRDPRMQYVVVDSEPPGYLAFGMAARISAELGARHYKIEDLAAGDLAAVVKDARHA
ncbi:MAG: putative cobaltochelatase [Desulfatibacillaceae bacterium]